jgi:hypothetical protein
MSKSFRPLMAFLILTVVTLACDVPLPQFPPTLTSGTPIPPASPDPDDLGTAVAATLTALVPGPVDGSPTATASTASPPTPDGGSTTLLLRSF